MNPRFYMSIVGPVNFRVQQQKLLVLNLSTTRDLNALCHNNTETRRIITMWSGSTTSRPKNSSFVSLWKYAHKGEYEYAMTAPVPPQIVVQNGTCEISNFVFENWCITQLIRMAPTLFPGCNLDATPPELDGYDFFSCAHRSSLGVNCIKRTDPST